MCLRPQGFVALSVPDRERWQTSQDLLEFPANHFLRKNLAALKVSVHCRPGVFPCDSNSNGPHSLECSCR